MIFGFQYYIMREKRTLLRRNSQLFQVMCLFKVWQDENFVDGYIQEDFFFFSFSIILVIISLVSMFLKHFNKLTSLVCQTRFQLRKSSLIHSIYALSEAVVDFLYMWISSLIHSIQALDLENTEKKKERIFCRWVWFCKQRWQQRGGFGFAVGGFGFASDFTRQVLYFFHYFFFFSFFLLRSSSSLFFLFVSQISKTKLSA